MNFAIVKAQVINDTSITNVRKRIERYQEQPATAITVTKNTSMI